jgi:hypothetical protein
MSGVSVTVMLESVMCAARAVLDDDHDHDHDDAM